jgi:hypothetical protein
VTIQKWWIFEFGKEWKFLKKYFKLRNANIRYWMWRPETVQVDEDYSFSLGGCEDSGNVMNQEKEHQRMWAQLRNLMWTCYFWRPVRMVVIFRGRNWDLEPRQVSNFEGINGFWDPFWFWRHCVLSHCK